MSTKYIFSIQHESEEVGIDGDKYTSIAISHIIAPNLIAAITEFQCRRPGTRIESIRCEGEVEAVV